MGKRYVAKNSTKQLVVIPKVTLTTLTDPILLSVQFQQIQEAARQQVLQQNVSHTSQFLQNIKIIDDITLPIDPSTEESQKTSSLEQIPLIIVVLPWCVPPMQDQ